MNGETSIAQLLTVGEHLRFLDWLEYFEGVESGEANDLTLIDDDHPDHARAVELFIKWRQWLAEVATPDPIQRIIDAAASAGMTLVRACDLSQNEQPQAANLGRSDSSTASTDSIVDGHEG